jgi:hypothetical protein
MSRLCQTIFVVAVLAVFSLHAQNFPPFPGQRIPSTNLPPPPPQLQPPSPVNFFRQLLAMTPAERIRSLTNRPPETRARIQAKVREYLVLAPDDRELRLRATELRWYLTPMFRAEPEERATRVSQVPEDLREIVKSRLTQWDLLPPPLQKEFLDSDRAVHYFAHVEVTNTAVVNPEQAKISEQFQQFFEFTADEKSQVLGTLSEVERAQMEKTLQSFEQLPLQQRHQCVKNFAKFAGMAPAERVEFLKDAERWSKMSPQERQSWRDLVLHVPQWPPLPPTTVPRELIPPTLAKIPRAGVATN